jgi:type II secretory ATPase GspE/PulE/Tfp pilus assembly ATPase PilB-like protein
MALLGDMAGRAPLANGAAPSEIVQSVLIAAADARASDVHFEPVDGGLEVRFRLDGVLQKAGEVPSALAAPVIARVKVLAGLATYRTDVPQDGRIPASALGGKKKEGKEGKRKPEGDAPPRSDAGLSAAAQAGTDLRVSTYPTVRGEKAVVRLFAARAEDFRLDALGLGRETVGVLEDALAGRDGLVVLTGPAGSGKTTTIYAAIRHLTESRPQGPTGKDAVAAKRQVVTIEDPVECLLPGVTQTETNPPAGLTFANCLRSILRQDPEVIMVGEVRDGETASLALEAALTGHLVVTTLHAGTAAGVFARLLEMGIEPYLITSVVRASLAQRLVRRLCPDCRSEVEGAWAAPGCQKCLGTGFRGRLPLAEVVTLAPELRSRVLARADLDELERAARESGMAPLAERGEELVRRGETAADEVARVLSGPASGRRSGRA